MILDTDVLIDVLRGTPRSDAWLGSLGYAQTCISLISHMEALQGCFTKEARNGLRDFLHMHVRKVIPLSQRIGETGLHLMERNRPHMDLRVEDALIASTALCLGDALITYNLKHFAPIQGLTVIRPDYR